MFLHGAHLYVQQRTLHSRCDILLVTSLCVARETSPVLVGVPLSLGPVAPLVLQQRTQWFLSSCIVVCMLLSHCDAWSTHKLWPGALCSCTVLGFLFSCDVVAPSSFAVITLVAVCKGQFYSSGEVSNLVLSKRLLSSCSGVQLSSCGRGSNF